MIVDSQPLLFRPRLLVEVLFVVLLRRPSEALAHERRAQVLARRCTCGNALAIDVALSFLAVHSATLHQGLKACFRDGACRPSVGAMLFALRRVNAPEPIELPVQYKRVSIDHLSTSVRADQRNVGRQQPSGGSVAHDRSLKTVGQSNRS